jgi:hypothetical protein
MGGMPTKYPEVVETYASVSRAILDGEGDE